MNSVKIACLQYQWKETPEDNLSFIRQQITEIGEAKKADVIFLPEFIIGAPFHFPGRAHLKGIVDDTIPGKITSALAVLARKYGLYLFGGTIVERDGDRYYNSCFVLGPDGGLLGKTRKSHCYAAEMVSLSAGNDLLVLDLPFGKVGVLVCSDFWIPEMPRILSLKGAEIIYVAGSSLIQNRELVKPCMLANSVFNVCYTVFTSVIGKVVGRRVNDSKFKIEFSGDTTVAGPSGLLAWLEGEEDVLYAQLDMEAVRAARMVDIKFQKTHFFSLWGRRPEMYHDLLKHYSGKEEELDELVDQYLNGKGGTE